MLKPIQDFFCASPENIHELRPFYWVLTFVLVVLYGWSVIASSLLQDPAHFALFTALMSIHIAFHWIGPYLTCRRFWLLPYLIAQGALAFIISFLAGTQGATMGLYLALIGTAVGVLENSRLSLIAVLGYIALSGVNVYLFWGWIAIPSWFTVAVPMGFLAMVYVNLFVRQGKERIHAQQLLRELETAHRELSEYAARVEDLTIAEERQRMARELHDTLAQGVAGLILQLEAANSHLASGRPERAQAIIQQAMTRARATLTDARRAIDDLRARQFEACCLDEAIRQEAERFTNATGIPCELDLAMMPEPPDPIRENVLRIVSEGLTNIARHAQASHAWLKAASADGCVVIHLRDDGIGFDSSDAANKSGHYGLLGMRERARLAGGSLAVESAPGAGTTVCLRLPMNSG
ncbi:two-component system, NarL family, sensor histidine kinase YdfH [Anaerolineae bacterium]|nr:two-component system, NarL family, sensor histidine kinase YdfH [Anaerolineae bacterium]